MESAEPNAPADHSQAAMKALRQQIGTWVRELGFAAFGVTGTDLGDNPARLADWIAAGRHGEMGWFEANHDKRTQPDKLTPGTRRIISVRLDYLPEDQAQARALLDHPTRAYVSRYALGRDYHKLIRPRLQKLANRITEAAGQFGYRAFVDSAPVMEKPIAANAGLGWLGKHTNVINRHSGSWFFLGELFTDLPLPVDTPASDHCGSCTACIEVCPTQAITAPYELDARRCISYLTIEHDGDIPEALRPAIGNRVFGCDDCQLFCPWNKFARLTAESDFAPRHGLDDVALAELAGWSEDEWLKRTEGSAIRRAGIRRWRRNLAVALGNATPGRATTDALRELADNDDAQIRRHAEWGLAQHEQNHDSTRPSS